jgi:hypothetical protein
MTCYFLKKEVESNYRLKLTIINVTSVTAFKNLTASIYKCYTIFHTFIIFSQFFFIHFQLILFVRSVVIYPLLIHSSTSFMLK